MLKLLKWIAYLTPFEILTENDYIALINAVNELLYQAEKVGFSYLTIKRQISELENIFQKSSLRVGNIILIHRQKLKPIIKELVYWEQKILSSYLKSFTFKEIKEEDLPIWATVICGGIGIILATIKTYWWVKLSIGFCGAILLTGLLFLEAKRKVEQQRR